MISNYIEIFIQYLNTHGEILYTFLPILVFFAAAMESTPILGTFTPGTLFLLFFGFTTYSLADNISLIIFAATIGSVFGDIMGYLLGKYGTDFLLRHKKLLKHSHIEDGRRFFSNHGFKSILIGRFVGPIRPIVPLIAGGIKMNLSKFLFYDILSSVLWATLYIMIGYYFGNYFREIEKVVSNISVLITLIIVLGFIWYYFRIKKKNGKQQDK